METPKIIKLIKAMNKNYKFICIDNYEANEFKYKNKKFRLKIESFQHEIHYEFTFYDYNISYNSYFPNLINYKKDFDDLYLNLLRLDPNKDEISQILLDE